jgi:hypothetical protein
MEVVVLPMEVVSLLTRCAWLLALEGSCTDVENDGWGERLEGSVQELRLVGGSRADAGACKERDAPLGLHKWLTKMSKGGGAVWVNEGNDDLECQLKHIIRVYWRCVMVMGDGENLGSCRTLAEFEVYFHSWGPSHCCTNPSMSLPDSTFT